MGRLLVPVLVLLMLAMNAPTNAQALVSPYLPDLLGGNEPIALLLTGAAFLGVARITRRRPD